MLPLSDRVSPISLIGKGWIAAGIFRPMFLAIISYAPFAYRGLISIKRIRKEIGCMKIIFFKLMNGRKE